MKPTDYREVDRFRTNYLTSYLIRNNNGKISGYNTVYSPGEKIFGIKVLKNDVLIGYLTGVSNRNYIIFYEIILENQQIIYNILDFLNKKNEFSTFFFNLSNNNKIIDFLKNVFGDIEINTPKISMYLYKNIDDFKPISEFYIPFSDRI